MSLFEKDVEAIKRSTRDTRTGKYDISFDDDTMEVVQRWSIDNLIDQRNMGNGSLMDVYGQYGLLKSQYMLKGEADNGKIILGFIKGLGNLAQGTANVVAESDLSNTLALTSDVVSSMANPYRDLEEGSGMVTALNNFITTQPIAQTLDKMLPNEVLGGPGTFGEFLSWGAGFSKAYSWTARHVQNKFLAGLSADILANTTLSRKGEANLANIITEFFGYDEEDTNNIILKGASWLETDEDDTQLMTGLKSTGIDLVAYGSGKSLLGVYKGIKHLIKNPEVAEDIIDITTKTDLKIKPQIETNTIEAE